MPKFFADIGNLTMFLLEERAREFGDPRFSLLLTP